MSIYLYRFTVGITVGSLPAILVVANLWRSIPYWLSNSLVKIRFITCTAFVEFHDGTWILRLHQSISCYYILYWVGKKSNPRKNYEWTTLQAYLLQNLRVTLRIFQEISLSNLNINFWMITQNTLNITFNPNLPFLVLFLFPLLQPCHLVHFEHLFFLWIICIVRYNSESKPIIE